MHSVHGHTDREASDGLRCLGHSAAGRIKPRPYPVCAEIAYRQRALKLQLAPRPKATLQLRRLLHWHRRTGPGSMGARGRHPTVSGPMPPPLSVDQALARILDGVEPTPVAAGPVEPAPRPTLAEPLAALLTQPPFDAS